MSERRDELATPAQRCGLTTEELATRIGCGAEWLENLLKEMPAPRLVEWVDGRWRLTPRATERYGCALSALPRLSSNVRSGRLPT